VALDFCRENLRAEIDELRVVYPNIIVSYFLLYLDPGRVTYIVLQPASTVWVASTQEIPESCPRVFEALEKPRSFALGRNILLETKLTEADIRLWLSIVRNFVGDARLDQ